MNFLVLIFFILLSVKSLHSENKCDYIYRTLMFDQYNTIFEYIPNYDYLCYANTERYKEVCPNGAIKIIRGYIVDNEVVKAKEYYGNILGCDTMEMFKQDFIYKFLYSRNLLNFYNDDDLTNNNHYGFNHKTANIIY